jgi:hypothetical protein
MFLHLFAGRALPPARRPRFFHLLAGQGFPACSQAKVSHLFAGRVLLGIYNERQLATDLKQKQDFVAMYFAFYFVSRSSTLMESIPQRSLFEPEQFWTRLGVLFTFFVTF